MTPTRQFPAFVAAVAFWSMVSALTYSQLVEAGDGQPCSAMTFEGKKYTACEADIRKHHVVVALHKAKGGVGTIAGYLDVRPFPREKLVFAMNGGMYEPDLRPVGLLVEGGQEKAKVSTAEGSGNFYWKPNGIFFVGSSRVGIRTSEAYADAPPKADYATQSGPMLVVQGQIDKRILSSTISRNIRNGVGVRDAYTAVFVISDEPVSFSEFARLFRDGLLCSDALYLDGVISELVAPSLNRKDRSGVLGPIVAVFER